MHAILVFYLHYADANYLPVATIHWYKVPLLDDGNAVFITFQIIPK